MTEGKSYSDHPREAKPRIRTEPLDSISPTDAAWVAGFFDGEGCICVVADKAKKSGLRWYKLFLSITNTSKESLDRIRSLFGFGSVYSRKPVPGRLRTYQMHLTCRVAEVFLRTIRPYLIVKRERADLALEFRDLQQSRPFAQVPLEARERMCRIAEAIRGLNGRHYRKDVSAVPELFVPA